ncbi:MAG: hypothetical protein IKQ71_07635 [Lachnospiraceae bacterium]|nr:hypothetical protein [Lachnospiraceae bacterium]
MSAYDASALGALVGFIAFLGILTLVLYIIEVIAMWKIFTKGGQAGWKSLIPIYNYYVLYDITWQAPIGFAYGVMFFVNTLERNKIIALPGFLSLSISLAILVLHIMQSIKMAKAFGKGTGFAIGLILLQPIFLLILGYGRAEYVGKEE